MYALSHSHSRNADSPSVSGFSARLKVVDIPYVGLDVLRARLQAEWKLSDSDVGYLLVHLGGNMGDLEEVSALRWINPIRRMMSLVFVFSPPQELSMI